MKAANDNVPPDAPVRLADALPLAFPLGGMTVSGLRLEAGRGRLTIMRIANKDFTTLAAIEEMKQKCLVPANQRGFGSGLAARTGKPSGSSSTESNTALAAANMIVQRLSKRSPSTSPNAS